MARRRRFGYNVPNMGAPTVIPVAKITANFPALTEAYSWLVADRMVALTLALEWYDNNAPALMVSGDKGKVSFTADDQKVLDVASKSKKLGDSSEHEAEKINGWTNAIRRYEKVWGAHHKALPKLDDANANPVPLGKEVAAQQTVLSNLNNAFGQFGVTFRLTAGTEREFHKGGVILLPRVELIALAGQTPLKAVLGEILTVAQVISAPYVENQPVFDGQLFLTNMPLVINAANTWAMTQGVSLVKPVGVFKAARQPKAGGAPRQPRQPGVGPKIPARGVIALTGMVCRMKGKRLEVFQLIHSGMTIAELKAAAVTKFGSSSWNARTTQVLQACLDAGLVSIN